MKVIIYQEENNGLVVLYPAYQPEWSQQQQDDFLLFVQNKDVPNLSDGSKRKSWIIDGEQTLPLKYIRKAWKINNDGEIYFDRLEAENVKKDQFRFLREPLLEKLDVQFMKAIEFGATSSLSEISSKKQILRDITNIDLSSYDTPEKLHSFIPEVLRSTV